MTGDGLPLPAGLLLTAVLLVAFTLLSLFRAAAGALARSATGTRWEWDGEPQAGREEPHDPPPERLRMAVQGTRHACVLGAALILSAAFRSAGLAAAQILAFLATLVVFSLIVDQVLARSIVLLDPARVYGLTLPAARVLSAPLVPLIAPVRHLLEALRRTLGRPPEAGDAPGETEGTAEAAERDRLREVQGEMIENVVEFSGTLLREVMTPRTEMVTIEKDASVADLMDLVVRTNHSRIPVTSGGADHVVGLVHSRDLFGLLSGGGADRGFSEVIRPIASVPESKRALELLREMQVQGLQMAVVVDEYGGTAGLVTTEDLLEEVVGEIADEHEIPRPDLIGQQDGSYVIRGSMPVSDLEERLELRLPQVEADTVGGLIVALLGRLPEAGERVETDAVCLEVTEADSRRVRRVRVLPRASREAGRDTETTRG